MLEKDKEELLKREEEFHDIWADNEDINSIDVHALFESFLAFENKYILSKMGDLKGKTILDIGAGLGESSVYFAIKGAKVFYNDISPKMADFAKKLAERYNVSLEYIVCPIEKIDIENQKFDFIHCANLMHHISKEDQESWIRTMASALDENGALFTWDPLKYNPVINVYRSMATEVRTIDEMPLGFDILEIYKKYFKTVEHKENWLFTLLIFIYYYFIKRFHPNDVRYWKQIYKEKESEIGWWFKPLIFLDNVIMKVPFLNYLAWTTTVYARKK